MPAVGCDVHLSYRKKSHGAVLVELAVVVFLFILLLCGAIDMSFVFREEMLLNQALHVATRTIAAAPPYEDLGCESDLICAADPDAAYVEDRHQRAIVLARYLLTQNGLNPNNYNVVASGSTRSVAGRSYNSLRLTIGVAGSADRYVIMPEGWVRPCAMSDTILSGTVLASGSTVAYPTGATACTPSG